MAYQPRKSAQKACYEQRDPGEAKLLTCALSLPFRPFSALLALFCFWSFVTEMSLLWLYKERSHLQKSRKFDILFAQTIHCSQHGFEETKYCEEIYINYPKIILKREPRHNPLFTVNFVLFPSLALIILLNRLEIGFDYRLFS